MRGGDLWCPGRGGRANGDVNTHTHTPHGEANPTSSILSDSQARHYSQPALYVIMASCLPGLWTRGWYPPTHSTAHLSTRHGRDRLQENGIALYGLVHVQSAFLV